MADHPSKQITDRWLLRELKDFGYDISGADTQRYKEEITLFRNGWQEKGLEWSKADHRLWPSLCQHLEDHGFHSPMFAEDQRRAAETNRQTGSHRRDPGESK